MVTELPYTGKYAHLRGDIKIPHSRMTKTYRKTFLPYL